jgi:hypothetical protein
LRYLNIRDLCIVLGCIVCLAFFRQESAASDHSMHMGKTANPTTNSTVIKILQDMDEQAKALKKKGEDLRIGGPNIPIPPQSQGDDFWSGMLQVTQMNNPLISSQCRRGAVEKAKEAIGGPEKALAHASEHLEEWRHVLQGDRQMSIDQYLEHMVNCKEFCGPLIGSLIKCHVDSAKNCSPLIVMFDVASPKDLAFRFPPGDESAIREFATRMRSERRKILLESRASILNGRERLLYNLPLSRRRAAVVRDILIEAGFPSEDILVKSLCWEPPRLAITDIAEAYGFGEVRRRLQNSQSMDQSVVLLGYNRDSSVTH